MAVNIIPNGNILNANELIIIQQLNCVTSYPKGLSKSIFDKWPDANIYKQRTSHSKPGTNHIIQSDKILVGLFSQYYPGKSYYTNDTYKMRLEWFKQCLDNLIIELNDCKEVAMPYLIGCGLAGGNWDKYLTIIKEWAMTNHIIVNLYDLENKSKK